jgi:tetratricopeptide (TPR) repeat protein
MKKLLALLIIALSFVSIRAEDSTQVDYYSPENIRTFADFLYQQKDFIRAGWEYDRLKVLTTNAVISDSALFKAGLAYMKGGDYDRAEQRFQSLINENKATPLIMDSKYYYARVGYFQGKLLQVSDFLEEQDYHNDRQLVLNGSLDILALTYARMNLWDKAKDIGCKNRYGLPSEHSSTLCSLVVDGQKLPQKSEFKACLLSAVVPGAGKLYAHRKTDALFAFILVGMTSWQAYEGFDRDGSSSVQGWIYGVLAGGLYLGNIYGAAVSVDIFNRNQKERYFDDFERAIGLKSP